MTGTIPNIPLRNWRTQRHLSRAEMADRINATPSGVADRLPCDEERIRRWESGEVRWPSPPYRRALKELTGLEPAHLGFIPSGPTAQPPAVTLDIEPPEALWPETKGQAASLARVRGHPLHGAGGHGANSRSSWA